MSYVSQVLAILVIIALFTSAVVIIHTENNKFYAQYLFQKNKNVLRAQADQDLSEVLLLTEPQTGLSVGELIATGVYYRTETVQANGRTVEVQKTIEGLLDAVYGDDRYYLEAENATQIELVFVVDSSLSMRDDVDRIVSVITRLRRELRKTHEVHATIYLINAGGPHSMDCSIIPENVLSCAPLDMERAYATFPEVQNLLDSERAYANIQYWEDWATALAYVMRVHLDNADEFGKYWLLFPISDELSGGSEPARCWPGKSGDEEVYCSICAQHCPYERADLVVQNAAAEAERHAFRVYPMISDRCGNNPRAQNFLKCNAQGTSWGTESCCTANQCGGCTITQNGDACYHSECDELLVADMEILAASGNGFVTDLAADDSIDELYARMREAIEQARFVLQAGAQKERDRMIIVQDVFLPSGAKIPIRFWFYPGESRTESVQETGETQTV